MFDSVDSSIRRGPNSIVFRKALQVFCIELEEYRPSELGTKVFRSKRKEMRKKLGGTYKRESY